ncbi:MAG: PAS domain-containing protein, partial [Deltaproteobacteria bacterium]|nr:PAS domain-containing protein [Deltaproteobacteria bacterium]
VDAQDTVRYFSHGRERIFGRSKAILGRKVQFCHPPNSVDTVERILADFRAGKQTHAHFWITMGKRLISIEYFAMHDKL